MTAEEHEQRSCAAVAVGLLLPFIASSALLVAFTSKGAMKSWQLALLCFPWVVGLVTAAMLVHRWQLLRVQPSRPATEPDRNPEGSSALATAAVLVIFIFSVKLGPEIQQGWLSWSARDWPSTNGLIEGCRVEPFSYEDEGEDGTEFYLSGSYVYRVGEEVRRGYRLEFFAKPYSGAAAEVERRRRFKPGSEIQVVYDPTIEGGSFIDDSSKPSLRKSHLSIFVYTVLILGALASFAWDSGLGAAIVAAGMSALMIALGAYTFHNRDARMEHDVIVQAELDPSAILAALRKSAKGTAKGALQLKGGLTPLQIQESRGRPNVVELTKDGLRLHYGSAHQTILTLRKDETGEYRLILNDSEM
jgi:hypothetical protein